MNSSSELLWAKRKWVFAAAACLAYSPFSQSTVFMLLNSAVCLIIALRSQELLSDARGEPRNWVNVFDPEFSLKSSKSDKKGG